jgi:hypothetical protein
MAVSMMRHLHMQFSEIQKLEWEDFVWIYDELVRSLAPPTPPKKVETRKPIGEAI